MRKSRVRSTRDYIYRILTGGSIGGIIGLGVATIFLVAIGATIASIFHIHAGEEDLSIVDAGWEILQRAIDPGQLDGELKWESRVLLLVITAIGILLISTLISIVNSTIERKIEQLRRGRGPVRANEHIVILGWNSLGTKITEELSAAYRDAREFEVVIMSDHDPVEVLREVQEDLFRRNSLGRKPLEARRPESWLTVRRGNIKNVEDLDQLARLGQAHSVVILNDTRSDAEITNVVLAVVASIQNPPTTRHSPLKIIASFKSNELASQLTRRIRALSSNPESTGAPIAELIPITPAFIRTGIEAQVTRHRGLSEVYRDLLDFDGDELYIVYPSRADLTFGQVVCTEGIIPIGIITNGVVDLWPEWNDSIADHGVIILAKTLKDAERILVEKADPSMIGERKQGRPVRILPENFLIIGWNSGAKNLVRSLFATSPKGSRVRILAHVGLVDEGAIREIFPTIEFATRDDASDPLDDREYLEEFHHVIVLAHEELDDTAASDAAVLGDVLACRIHVDETNEGRDQPITVVAELLNYVSKNIAGVRLADDLLLTDSLGASAMAHLAVHPNLLPVLSALLDSEGKHSVHLTSLESESSRFTDQLWADVRQQIMRSTGEIPIAIRESRINPRVQINPDARRRIYPHEEIIVLSKSPYSPGTET